MQGRGVPGTGSAMAPPADNENARRQPARSEAKVTNKHRREDTMPAEISYIPEEERLDLSIRGNLDLTVSEEICGLCRRLPPALRYCIIDLSQVERLFDSGLALIQMLHGRLSEAGAKVVILSDSLEIRERMLRFAHSLFPPVDAGVPVAPSVGPGADVSFRRR